MYDLGDDGIAGLHKHAVQTSVLAVRATLGGWCERRAPSHRMTLGDDANPRKSSPPLPSERTLRLRGHARAPYWLESLPRQAVARKRRKKPRSRHPGETRIHLPLRLGEPHHRRRGSACRWPPWAALVPRGIGDGPHRGYTSATASGRHPLSPSSPSWPQRVLASGPSHSPARRRAVGLDDHISYLPGKRLDFRGEGPGDADVQRRLLETKLELGEPAAAPCRAPARWRWESPQSRVGTRRGHSAPESFARL
jgi:hypothetical protein